MSNAPCKVAYYTFDQPHKSDSSVVFSDADRVRFWSNVRRSRGCWLWTGPDDTRYGYGRFRRMAAHRVAWELTNGPIPDGKHCLHGCDNPPCVNPAHLFLGTHRNNMEDAARKGRLHVQRPSRQTVSDASLSQMRELAASGIKQIDIARRFGVSKAFISLLLKGKRRQHPVPRMVVSR